MLVFKDRRKDRLIAFVSVAVNESPNLKIIIYIKNFLK